MTFGIDIDWPGNHRRGIISDEHAASSYELPVLVFDGESHGVADLPFGTKIVVAWRKPRTGPVWALIQRAINAGFPIEEWDLSCPLCEECDNLMHKAGFVWSGRQKVQRWRCNQCGKTTTIS